MLPVLPSYSSLQSSTTESPFIIGHMLDVDAAVSGNDQLNHGVREVL
jgi:hypothetical protein